MNKLLQDLIDEIKAMKTALSNKLDGVISAVNNAADNIASRFEWQDED